MKRADPAHWITVYERNRLDDTYGFGVVFSDATLDNLAAADPDTHARILAEFAHWDDIEIHYRGEVIRSTGHGFAGLDRQRLLEILGERCDELDVELEFESELTTVKQMSDVDLVVAADGANSMLREQHAADFQPVIDWRPNRFVWLGTTRPFPAFTFYFRHDGHGLWRVHAYRYAEGRSTFIVETTEETLGAAGLEDASERETVAFCEAMFASELEGHRLISNRSIWRRFPTVRNGSWSVRNIVLIGDAAHTAHFSVGSGTKLAMEDAIALSDALRVETDVPTALAAYEEERRPLVESLQRAAQASLQWFEGTERYMETEPVQFGFNLLTRSLRITHEDLRVRDPELTAQIDRWFAEEASRQSGVPIDLDDPPPPLFTPFKLREMVLANRVVVSAMCQYSAEDGSPTDWHFVHLGSRAVGGAGLVFSEMTDISREARISPGCAGMYRPEHVAAWKRIVDFVHDNTEAKIGLQLGHAGRKGSTRLAWEGMDEPLESGNWEIVGPSPIPYFPHSQVPREMDRDDMDAIRDDFVRAAKMAEEAGFDIIELHFAHGYLLASFVSPLTNQRRDEYGGSLENRLRFPLEVLDAVRAVWPEHKPISVRISAVDWAPGGTEVTDAVEIARTLKAHGCRHCPTPSQSTAVSFKPRSATGFVTRQKSRRWRSATSRRTWT
jgi:anthraniloyl-CoA monooxygenase